MRAVLTSLGEVAGIVLTAVGAGVFHVGAGLVVFGLGLFAVSYVAGDE